MGSAKPVFQWLWVWFIGLLGLVTIKQLARIQRTQLKRIPFISTIFTLMVVAWGSAFCAMLKANAASGIHYLDPLMEIKVATIITQHVVYFFILYFFGPDFETRIRVVAYTVTAYAAWGLIEYFRVPPPTTGHALWQYYEVSSFFVNRNNFGTYAAVGLICLTGILGRSFRQAFAARKGGYFEPEEFIQNTVFYILLYSIVGSSLFLSGSRGAMLAFCVGALFYFIMHLRMGGGVGGWLVSLSSILLILILLAGVSGDSLLNRFRLDNVNLDRIEIWRSVFEAIKQRPFFGHGLGSFEHVFPIFREAGGEGYFRRAHSDILEFVMGVGILPAILMAGSFVWDMKVVTGQNNGVHRGTIAVLVAVLAVYLFHSLIDFPFQIMAITMQLVFLISAPNLVRQ